MLALLRPGTSLAASPLPVRVDGGLAQGVVEDEVLIHRGLPYAAPPVGPLRWRPPVAPLRWAGVRDARRHGAHCPQQPGPSLEGGGDPGPLDEDCLFLNVFSPAAGGAGSASQAKHPVMVWIHGGALVQGGGGLDVYDGRALARQGVVVVTINYRLGALGFFAHPALERAQPGGAVNFGLLDQMAALRWVQRNIRAFGGDPAQVTVFGQSAGAQSVLALMASPLARGLFQRAMAQSPYGLPSHTRAKAVDYGSRVASAAGLPGARASAAALRALPAQQLAAPADPALSLAPSFVVGDAALPLPLIDAFRQGRQARVPLIIGSNSDEASVARAFGLDPADIVQRLGAARILVRPLFPGVADDAELGRHLVRDLAFSAYVRRMAVLHAAKAPTWRYWFSHVHTRRAGQLPGAAHGGEVPYALGTLERCACLGAPVQPADEAVAARMVQRWAAFARTGRPNVLDVPGGPDLPPWPQDTRLRPVVLAIDAQDSIEPAFLQPRLNALIGGLNLLPNPAGR